MYVHCQYVIFITKNTQWVFFVMHIKLFSCFNDSRSPNPKVVGRANNNIIYFLDSIIVVATFCGTIS